MVRSGSDGRQTPQQVMRVGSVQLVVGEEVAVECRVLFVWSEPVRRQAMQALQTDAEHDSTAWSESALRWQPRIGRCDGRWWAVRMGWA